VVNKLKVQSSKNFLDRIYRIARITLSDFLWLHDFEVFEISHCRAMAVAVSPFPEISSLISENDGSANTCHKNHISSALSFEH